MPLTKRMELLSGFTILPPTACDAYQVATYGPSHHYAAHIDSVLQLNFYLIETVECNLIYYIPSFNHVQFEDIRRSEEKGLFTFIYRIANVK